MKGRPEDKHILIVDDEGVSLLYLQRALAAAGFNNVETVRTVDEGFVQLRRRRPDLIILDIHMPGKDGLDMHEVLKHDPNLKKIPIIFVTVLGIKPHGSSEGNVVFAKPFDKEALLKKVCEFLA